MAWRLNSPGLFSLGRPWSGVRPRLRYVPLAAAFMAVPFGCSGSVIIDDQGRSSSSSSTMSPGSTSSRSGVSLSSTSSTSNYFPPEPRAPWPGSGYPYTFVEAPSEGSTILPVCDATGCTPALTSLCANGSVAAAADWGSIAGIGWAVNADSNGNIGTWAVAGSGINVTLSGTAPGARLQFEEPNASSNSQRYCAPIPSGGGLIRYSDLKTYCWKNPAVPPVALKPGTQVAYAAVVIPGNPTAAIRFDFCITDLRMVP